MDEGETIQLSAGRSLIDVRGDGFEELLLVGGQPIAMNWADCAGSVAQYLVRGGETNCEESLRSLRHLFEGNFQHEIPISTQIHPFLQLFSPAQYRLQFHASCPVSSYLLFDAAASQATNFDHFYPFDEHSLVFTRPTETLNQERIAYFAKRIEDGFRPIALTASVEKGWCNFVLDGHHKLQAYQLAKTDPSLIDVCRLKAPGLSVETFCGYLGANHPLAAHYRNVKTEYGSG